MLTVRQNVGTDNSLVYRDLRIVADGLTSQGFDVRSPAWEDAEFLRVTNVRGMLCEVTINSTGRVCWECRLCNGSHHDPAHVVNMVSGILGSDNSRFSGRPPMSIMSERGVSIETIADLVGHKTTVTTQKVYRKQLRPVITTGATTMNMILSEQKSAKSA